MNRWVAIMAAGLALGACEEPNPLAVPPRGDDDAAYTDLTLRTPVRETDPTALAVAAEQAWARGARVDARALAVAAVEAGSRDPSLLGLLARAAVAPAPTVRSERHLPRCERALRDVRRSTTLCLSAAGAWMQVGVGPWESLGDDVRDAVWTATGPVLLRGSGAVETVGGARLGEAAPTATLVASRDRVLSLRDGELRDVASGAVVLGQVSGLASGRNGAAWVARRTNELVVQGLHHRRTLPAVPGARALAVSALGTFVAVRTEDAVVRIEVATGAAARWEVPVKGPLAVSESGALAGVVDGEVAWRGPGGGVHRVAGEPVHLEFDSDVLVGLLPDRRLRAWDPPVSRHGALLSGQTVLLERERGRLLQLLEDGRWTVVSSDGDRSIATGRVAAGPRGAALHPSWRSVAILGARSVSVHPLGDSAEPPQTHAVSGARSIAWRRVDDGVQLTVLDDRGLHALSGDTLRADRTAGLASHRWEGGVAWLTSAAGAPPRAQRWPATPNSVAQVFAVDGATGVVAAPGLRGALVSTPVGVSLKSTNGDTLWTADAPIGALTCAAVHADGARVAVGGTSGQVSVLDSQGQELLSTPKLGPGPLRDLVWTRQGGVLAVDAQGALHALDTSILDAPPDRLWGRLAFDAGVQVSAEGQVVEQPWRSPPPALSSSR